MHADSTFAWTQCNGVSIRVYTRRRSAAGLFGPVSSLSDSGGDASGPQLAVASDAVARIVWKRFNGLTDRVQYRSMTPDVTLGPVQDLSASGQNANTPQIALDGTGQPYAGWTRYDGANWRVQIATGF